MIVHRHTYELGVWRIDTPCGRLTVLQGEVASCVAQDKSY